MPVLRKYWNGWECSLEADSPRTRSRGFLLRWPLPGLYRRVPAEARNLLRIGLPPLPLSRHGKGPKPSRLTVVRFHPEQNPLERSQKFPLPQIANREMQPLRPPDLSKARQQL